MNIHIEWGLRALDAEYDAVVIVDCLSFSTAVCVATANGGIIYPFGVEHEVQDFATNINLAIANRRHEGGLSLSPPSLVQLAAKEELILPSPNGSALSLFANANLLIAGCLRNAKAVADRLNMENPEKIMMVAAGEKWPDDSLRPAFEDWVACGAIIAQLNGEKCTEAASAEAVFEAAKSDLQQHLMGCISGQELCGRGFEQDVIWAADIDADVHVPTLHNMTRTYVDFGVVDKKIRHKNIRYYMA